MITPSQVRMARAALGWGVRELAEKAGVAVNTVSRFENDFGAMVETLAANSRLHSRRQGWFSSRPIRPGGPGVRLREAPTRKAKRRRSR